MWFPADSTCPFGVPKPGMALVSLKIRRAGRRISWVLGSIPSLQNPNLEAKRRSHPYVRQTRKDGVPGLRSHRAGPGVWRCCPDLRGSVMVIGLSDWTFHSRIKHDARTFAAIFTARR